MAKSTILLMLSISLALQLITAHPYPNSNNSIGQNRIKESKLQLSNGEQRNENEFRKQLQPVILNTLALVQKHSNTLITESSSFIHDLLVELNLLHTENPYIKQLTSTLANLVERMDNFDLYDDSPTSLREKAALLHNLSDMFNGFDSITKNADKNKTTLILNGILQKLNVDILNEHVQKSAKNAVEKFNTVFLTFWNSLSVAEKRAHEHLSDWYERYQAIETAQEKLKAFVEFLQILKSIVVDGE